MEFRLFGPLEVRNATGSVDVGPPRQRTVLAALLVDAGRLVPVNTVVDRVWGEAPPDRVRHSLYVYVARLRQALGPSVRLVNRSGGYVAEVDPDTVDLHRFRHLVEHARDRRRPDTERAALLRQALDLWRGTPLADLPGEWVARVREAWRQQHLDATVSWAQAELAIGHAAGIVSTLIDLTAEYPLAEPLTAALMRALHETGRGAEALDHYSRVRRRLGDEIGTEPGAELRDLYQSILRCGNARPAPAQTAPSGQAPALLPMDVYGFTGRGAELAQLGTTLAAADGHPTAVVISAISGTAGVGKTALAVHWAHRSAHRFPDGQLYVNLRGFDPSGSVMGAAEAVRGFLDALQVPAERVPAGLAAQVGLYRSMLAGKRMLIVLDNARDAEQVRPLLPGAPGCLVLVTSRDQLTGLVAAEGAQPLLVDVLPPGEARQLLARRLGASRVAAEPDATDRIIRSCAGLPIALAIVAARAAVRPSEPLAALAEELATAGKSLDIFDGGDVVTDMRAVFSWSYRTLSEQAGRLFRLVGLHPGPDISTAAAASLAGTSVAGVTHPLAELVRAHLITERTPGRFAYHDLLRMYAREQALAEETDGERYAALHRTLDHYLHTAHAAALLITPRLDPVIADAPHDGVTPEHLVDHEHALAWLATEQQVLLAAIEQASDAGFDTHACRLPWVLADFLDRRGSWSELEACQRIAIEAAQRLGDQLSEARANVQLGRAYARLGEHDSAHAHLARAGQLYERLGELGGQAHTHTVLCGLLERQGRLREALGHGRQALDLHRATGHLAGQAVALNWIGWLHALLGEHQQAIASCEQALRLHQELADRGGQADTWHSLGYAHHRVGEPRQAATCYQNALRLYRDLGDQNHEAVVLSDLGESELTAGAPDAARTAWLEALTILEALGRPAADDVRAKLARHFASA
jgi:DNA-binding SARP family transcriptional activator/tetratricopeptide (TPR) repeat protein